MLSLGHRGCNKPPHAKFKLAWGGVFDRWRDRGVDCVFFDFLRGRQYMWTYVHTYTHTHTAYGVLIDSQLRVLNHL